MYVRVRVLVCMLRVHISSAGDSPLKSGTVSKSRVEESVLLAQGPPCLGGLAPRGQVRTGEP